MTAQDSPARPSNWNAPNIITVARIIATPFFLWMLLADGGQGGPLRWASAVFFVLAIATDAWDGHLARSRGLITDLGKLLDPIADKALTGAALVGLSILGELPWWVTIVVLVREIGITVHRLMIAHDVVVAAAWMGKLKTVVQAVAITLALLPLAGVLGPAAPVAYWANVITMTAAVALTIISGVDYVVAFMRAKRVRS
ncbi:CDP-diacylglycerol--glycerol-3-phosphate 3-phosphatidyltransferase [Leucobacter muris]|jgi:CDP-diacylglycerol--glycerol-3-phosphate 3-phosphatidyltransferase|uniref:CDP-diacylglycerol--glycerol-3-phosphate 3-phosphatidyltransferase n=1 Tax=Leucobacter muris TaxID=1935379 RepID=A0ABX5QEC7_9MICO|nr:CDP-diacylglycerol--glycerol-3-phosphate 3-phosphatidyltransferase [Leucobacter muris]QAB17395.1 CDP-diacylglycerol--glycerol-3-phosphate 3-phosphatidyltransferase [Leucobacter muris]